MHRTVRPAAAVAALSLGLVVPGTAGASTETQTGGRFPPDTMSFLVGQVLDNATHAPVPEATIVLQDSTGRSAATGVSDSLGRFRIRHPGRGDRFMLTVEHVAFAASEGGIRFPPGERVRIEVLLARQVIRLDPIRVRERRRGRLAEVGFYARKAQGSGVFVDREEIDRRRPVRITDLLRGRTGFRVVSLGLGASDVRVLQQVSFQYRPDQCQPAVWIDGGLAREGGIPRAPVSASTAGPPLSALISPEHVEALEGYTGTAGLPSEYAGSNAPCGVILIWTRSPDRSTSG